MAPSWTKEQALAELRCLAEAATDELSGTWRLSAEHTRWVARALAVLEEVFGRESRYYLTFASYDWRASEPFMVGGPWDPEGSRDPQAAIERKHHEAYLKQLESARGLLLAAADHLERTDLATVYKGKDTPPEASAILRIIGLAEHKLRKVMRVKPEGERQVQDAFEGLLLGAEIAYSREADSIEYSSKTYTPDFTFPRIEMALEVKLCNRSAREKEIIAEINDDILAYRTKYPNLVFVVYDVGTIRDVDRFKGSFEGSEDIAVVVVKH